MNDTLLIIFLWCGGLALTSCGDSTADSSGGPGETSAVDSASANEVTVTRAQFERAGMELGKITTYTFANRVEANGYLDVPPQNLAEVSAYAEGYIHRIDLLVGDPVKKGQFLVSLINPQYLQLQQDYLDTKEQLVYLKAEYERQRTLEEEKIASQKNFLKAQSDYKSAAARVQGMKQRLELLNIDPARVEKSDFTSTINIYAPIAGQITNIHATLGSFVSPSDIILEVINKDHEHLELQVFEKDVLKLREEQAIEFRLPNTGDEVFRAEIHRVGQSVDPEKRTVTVHADLLEENPRFVTGMYVEAQILTDTVSAPALPESAVVQDQDQSYLLSLTNESDSQYVFEKQRVKTGRTADGQVELLDPQSLRSDRRVLVSGAFALIGDN
ncbi:MAG: efflux RND transporter periplasmic adaptor subunit [Tunicatimonas sp.]